MVVCVSTLCLAGTTIFQSCLGTIEALGYIDAAALAAHDYRETIIMLL